MLNIEVSASVLSADPLDFGKEVKKVEKSGAEMIHYDVMDGVFVTNITFGIPLLRSMNGKTGCILDVHLMITDPLKYIDDFADAGADIITFHVESESDTAETIKAIRRNGIKAAISVKPGTPADAVYPFINDVDMVLVMTVEPGFGGQKFMDMSEKISAIRKYADENRTSTTPLDIQVDGGIDNETAPIVKKAGANILVSGSYLFRSENMADAVTKLKEDNTTDAE
ncbi:MAG: ribulose-phosphate 3-epimerase [Ruminococcus sp.]|nr:ribulose-phosphate 3-epimerase [Ruminococcus sp.]